VGRFGERARWDATRAGRRRLAQRALGLFGDVPEFLKVEAG
jgi:hypothetical protein